MVRHLRSWPSALRSPLHDLGSVLFPSPCRLCGNSLLRLNRAPICDECWNRLAPQQGQVCSRCSEELHISVFAHVGGLQSDPIEQLCQPCRLAPPAFERAVAYGGYTGTLRSLIHALKYDSILAIADRLGILLADAVLKIDLNSECELLVVPVPLHPAKLRQRGFNHAELLAKATVRELHGRRPALKLTMAGDALERRKATQSQSGLSPHQRRANLRGVFFAPHAEQIAKRHILLLDDIYTTGATARACSQVLRRAGAASVHVATVARPQRENVAVAQFQNQEIPMEQDVAFWGATTTTVPLVAIAATRQSATQQPGV